ncbi:MAG: metallophosphoesterase [Clostridia bacterium]|nr:metallophosphoesterase [Clostridia bacterium]
MSRVLFASDLHHCHMFWHGVESDDRMERLVKAIKDEYEREPYDLFLMLGDYSLDFWAWSTKGCYVNEGKSYTEAFVSKIVPHIPCPSYMIAGNHEQYGHDKWKEITGCERRTAIAYRDALFILLDNYGGDLDPTEHSDGTYTPTDIAYVKEQMATHPDAKHVFLCAHEFDMRFEGEDFKALLREEDRIVALLAGHTHLSAIVPLGEECGGKLLLRTGQFSYSGNIKESRWGWRELRFDDDGKVSTAYITPSSDVVIDNEPSHAERGEQDAAVLVEGRE